MQVADATLESVVICVQPTSTCHRRSSATFGFPKFSEDFGHTLRDADLRVHKAAEGRLWSQWFVPGQASSPQASAVVAELSSSLDPKKRLMAVKLVGDMPKAQRLGYLLEHVRAPSVAGPSPVELSFLLCPHASAWRCSPPDAQQSNHCRSCKQRRENGQVAS